MLSSHQAHRDERQEASSAARPIMAIGILIFGLLGLLLSCLLSISVGAVNIHVHNVWQAIFSFDPSLPQHQIVRELRMPRAFAGAIVGACFAVAGVIMQGITRNPLADSGLLGLNAGAGFALAVCYAFFPHISILYTMFFSFLGAGLGAAVIYGLGSISSGGLKPVRLVLAGAAVSILFQALSEGIALYFQIGQDLSFWYAGGVAGTTWLQLKVMAPVTAGGLAAAMLLARKLNLLGLGDDVAAGLGVRINLVKLAALVVVMVIAGTAVSAVGGVAFVGLMIPHLARAMVGNDNRWVIPCSAVLGSLLVVWADIVSRLVHRPFETPLGAIIALIGVPFFLYMARRTERGL
ncbi:iron complex transport system permease protein [Paenibacillus sp. yr247]|uniref:FecCD family ABC transporter permease n=1 Tax=Paenibacillus sp. yr247 TaxID=1761880 RepID=UPI00088B16F3|nr:iron ABC transporter permease [Paenibacillus sp. yr247]SDN94388.1 iron complex transport system permease protein [Paenibacillus sp. yr247]